MMNRIYTIIVISLLGACSSSLDYQAALQKNQRKLDNENQVQDSRFLVEAKSLAHLQERLARKAAKNGYAASVVELGNEFAKDYKSFQDDLKKLADKEDMFLPSSLKNSHKEILDDLDEEDREDFDEEVLEVMERMSNEMEELFEDKAVSANDADVRGFAARKIGSFSQRQERIKSVQASLLNTF